MTSDLYLCPAGCGRTRALGKVLCLACWSRVPAPVQAAALRTGKAWMIDIDNPDKRRAYEHAAIEAVKSVTRDTSAQEFIVTYETGDESGLGLP